MITTYKQLKANPARRNGLDREQPAKIPQYVALESYHQIYFIESQCLSEYISRVFGEKGL